jgi:hypothetical protein
MSDSDNVARFRRLIDERFSGGDLGVVDELVAPDCIEHQRGNRPGVDGAKEVIRTLHRWMSDFTLTIEDVAVAGDLVLSGVVERHAVLSVDAQDRHPNRAVGG